VSERCAYPDCAQIAECAVHAQWTWFDFIDYPSCAVHREEIAEALLERVIDGSRPSDVWVQWWDPV